MLNEVSFSGKTYAILAAVGDYSDIGMVNLISYKMDMLLMHNAISTGLKVDKDNIRSLGIEGNVTAKEFAMVIKSFSTMLSKDDSLIFYFSGHGNNDELAFSDMTIKLSSVLTVLDNLQCKNKLAILDCCYSGDFNTARPEYGSFEDSINNFVGHGIAIMASSSANEVSRLGPGNNHSLYTGVVSTAMLSTRHIRKGILSLDNINADVFNIITTWNDQNPTAVQNPRFRISIGGTIYYKVADYSPYNQKQVFFETERYILKSVQPLSSPSIKRLCAFVIPKSNLEMDALAEITKEIAEKIKYEKVYSTKQSEVKFGDSPARAIWCYFGKDESDIIQHLHYAYTIWVEDQEMKSLYFKETSNTCINNEILVYENTSYAMIKEMQKSTISRTDYIKENKKLLSTIVSLAENFIYDLQEVINKTANINDFQSHYKDWINEVKKRYIQLSEIDVSPDDLYEWSNEIVSLAGWVLDLALLINGEIGQRETWLINNSIRNYNASLERLAHLEKLV